MLEHTTYGEAGPWVVLLHGWPDDARLWAPLIPPLLQAGYRCLAVTLPAFPTSALGRGADFPELVARLHATVRARTEAPVVVLGHDWGAYLAYLFERAHPEQVERMITLDVGGHFSPEGVRHALFLVGYQGWLIAAWAWGEVLPPLGDRMTRLLARLARAPRPDEVSARANYPYAYLWRALILPGHAQSLTRRYRPRRPLLYLYGRQKPFPFHSRAWLDLVAAGEGSEVVGVDRAGHWLQLDQPEVVAGHVVRWLGASASPAARHNPVGPG
jgi:pimeloyl-ACP methyl ester carboxylesterase